MSAADFADYLSCCEGFGGQMSDAVRAYTQALLKRIHTWLRIPREEWHKSWQGMRSPVRPLRLALYCHPDPGSHWEQPCDTALNQMEFEAIPNWPGCHIVRHLSGFLVVYVDDFKLVAPRKNFQALWKLIGQKLSLEPPTSFDRFLGCEARSVEAILDPSHISGLHNTS